MLSKDRYKEEYKWRKEEE